MSLAYLKRYDDLIYLATPFSKWAPGLDYACDQACIIAGRMIRAGLYPFSPIAHSFTIAKACGMDPLDHVLWMEQCRKQQRKCAALLIAELPGWHESEGIKLEWAEAYILQQPVYYLNPDNMMVTCCV
jgi:hypothetical protein